MTKICHNIDFPVPSTPLMTTFFPVRCNVIEIKHVSIYKGKIYMFRAVY